MGNIASAIGDLRVIKGVVAQTNQNRFVRSPLFLGSSFKQVCKKALSLD